MLQGIKSFTISTKSDKASAAKNTVLSVDLNGCSEEVAVGLAIQSLVIRRQNHYRKHGIPEKDSVKMSDFAPGSRQAPAPVTAETVRAMIPQFSPEDRAALLKLLQA